MTKQTVLVVEDEHDIREMIVFNLNKAEFRTQQAESGEQGLAFIREHIPDLVLLDLMLPGMTGLDVCHELKRHTATEDLPIIIVSAKGDESDVVTGLDMGADDYVAKPFSPKVLVARIKSVLRRQKVKMPGKNDPIRYGAFEINPQANEVKINEAVLSLTQTEFKILHALMRRPSWVFTRGQLVEAMYTGFQDVTERSIDVQVVGLRKKLGDYAKYIETVRGVGYRFQEAN